MPDDRDDMHASGFPEPDGPHPIAGLSEPATRWTCTHAELAAALHRTRQCRWMNDPALATMAREILAQLPEARSMPASAALLRTQLLAAVEEWWGTGHDLDALGAPLMILAEPFLAEIANLTAKISDYENAIN